MVTLTRKQQKSLKSKYLRDHSGHNTFLSFRRSVQPGMGCIMVRWCGMWLGIEECGHTHS